MRMIAGRADIVAGYIEGIAVIVEVKIADPVRAIGQLFAYKSGYDPSPTLILAVPERMQVDLVTLMACEEGNVELWYIEDNGEPRRLIGSRNPKYRKELIKGT